MRRTVGQHGLAVDDQAVWPVDILHQLRERRTRRRGVGLSCRGAGRYPGQGQRQPQINEWTATGHHRSASWRMLSICHVPFFRSSVMVILVAVLRVLRSLVVTTYSRRHVTVAVLFEID